MQQISPKNLKLLQTDTAYNEGDGMKAHRMLTLSFTLVRQRKLQINAEQHDYFRCSFIDLRVAAPLIVQSCPTGHSLSAY